MTLDERNAELERVEHCRRLIAAWVALLKAVQLYESGHNAVLSRAELITQLAGEIVHERGDLDLTARNDSIFVDGTRIREKAVGSASYTQLVALLVAARIASIRFDSESPSHEIEIVSRLVLELAEGERDPEDAQRELRLRGVTHVALVAIDEDAEEPDDATPHEIQKRIYLRSVGVLKGVFHELRSKDRINARRVKRAVQDMIEKLEFDPGYMLSLTNVKNFDEYTFNHSVNVGVLAIALGRAVGLSRRQLYVVGQAGMLHDIGKLCVPKEVLNKPDALTAEERLVMQSHPLEGFLSIASHQGISPDTVSVALGAYEHHLNPDGSGYPLPTKPRPIGFLSRLVAIVDRYDAMTSARVYRSRAIPPPQALAMLYDAHAGAVDRTLLTYFMNLLGTYPIGTVVRLSDTSIGVVVGGCEDPALWHLPTVQLVYNADGDPAREEAINLAEDAKSVDALHVIETLDAGSFGIDVSEYVL